MDFEDFLKVSEVSTDSEPVEETLSLQENGNQSITNEIEFEEIDDEEYILTLSSALKSNKTNERTPTQRNGSKTEKILPQLPKAKVPPPKPAKTEDVPPPESIIPPKTPANSTHKNKSDFAKTIIVSKSEGNVPSLTPTKLGDSTNKITPKSASNESKKTSKDAKPASKTIAFIPMQYLKYCTVKNGRYSVNLHKLKELDPSSNIIYCDTNPLEPANRNLSFKTVSNSASLVGKNLTSSLQNQLVESISKTNMDLTPFASQSDDAQNKKTVLVKPKETQITPKPSGSAKTALDKVNSVQNASVKNILDKQIPIAPKVNIALRNNLNQNQFTEKNLKTARNSTSASTLLGKRSTNKADKNSGSENGGPTPKKKKVVKKTLGILSSESPPLKPIEEILLNPGDVSGFIKETEDPDAILPCSPTSTSPPANYSFFSKNSAANQSPKDVIREQVDKLKELIKDNQGRSPLNVMVPSSWLKYCVCKNGKFFINSESIKQMQDEFAKTEPKPSKKVQETPIKSSLKKPVTLKNIMPAETKKSGTNIKRLNSSQSKDDISLDDIMKRIKAKKLREPILQKLNDSENYSPQFKRRRSFSSKYSDSDYDLSIVKKSKSICGDLPSLKELEYDLKRSDPPGQENLLLVNKVEVYSSKGRKLRTEHLASPRPSPSSSPALSVHLNKDLSIGSSLESIKKNLKACSVKLNRNNSVESRLKNLEETRAFLENSIIKHEKAVNLDPNKPLLVLSEKSYEVPNVDFELCKANNVFYVVSGDHAFPSSLLDSNFFKKMVSAKLIQIVEKPMLAFFFLSD